MTENAKEGILYVDTIRAVDINEDSITLSLLEAPENLELTDSIITWTPDSTQLEVNTISVQVSDGYGGFDTLNWIVYVYPSEVAFYPFSGNAQDESDNEQNATVSGATLTTDRFGNQGCAYYFNGDDAQIKIAHNAFWDEVFDSQFSIHFWFNSDTATDRRTIFSKYGGGNPSIEIEIGRGGAIRVNVRTNITDAFIELYASGGLDDNQWHNVTVNWNYPTLTVYIDNQLEATGTNTNVTTLTHPSEIVIGHIADVFPDRFWFKGKIDDIRIFKNPLSVSAIDSLYHLK